MLELATRTAPLRHRYPGIKQIIGSSGKEKKEDTKKKG
jgi:hypothetical protein